MLKLLGRATSSNVQKVIWCCEELQIPYERIDLGGKFGGLDDPAYRARNPNGTIPTIEDDGFVLWESHAILRYLAAGDATHKLLPQGRRQVAVVDQWLDWHPVAQGLKMRDLFMLLRRPEAAPPGATLERALGEAAASFKILNDRLADSPFVAGEQFTLADIPAAISAHRWFGLDIARPDLPALEAWYARIKARPAFAAIADIPAP